MKVVNTILVGAGPIGIEVAANLKRIAVEYLHFEAQSLAETILRWPRSTPFFSSPERVAIAGIPLHSRHQNMITGEEYLAYLRSVVEHYDLDINLWHRVLSARKLPSGLICLWVEHRMEIREYFCKKLILATGNMHSPRWLGISGEDFEHVDHYHSDVHRYFRQNLVIVGGRNSAVEAAIRSWRAGANVCLMQRKPELEEDRLNSRYCLEINILIRKGKIQFIPNAQPVEIRKKSIVYQGTSGLQEHPADFVLLCIGFDKHLGLLEELGVNINSDLSLSINQESMESNIANVYFAGTAVGGAKQSYKIFVGTSHIHVEKLISSAYQKEAIVGDYRKRVYPFSIEDIEPVEGSSN